MSNNEYVFTHENLEKELKRISDKKITELYVHDEKIASDKKNLINFLEVANRDIPEVYISIRINAQLLDSEVLKLLSTLFCSIEIPMTENVSKNISPEKKAVFLFDKKLYSKKAALLNNQGLVFGFDLDFALSKGDSFKQFRERLDFAVTLYPNHIDFPQIEIKNEKQEKCTGTYSSQDIEYSRKLALSTKVFYTKGRAVPWFNLILNALKIAPSKFFSDFAEWLECNNVNLDDNEKIEKFSHKEIEKMQLNFLEIKFEEKHKEHLFVVAKDLVSLYGAFSRVDCENEETILNLCFNPDDLLSPAIFNLNNFADNVCLDECKIKIFAGTDCPEYQII